MTDRSRPPVIALVGGTRYSARPLCADRRCAVLITVGHAPGEGTIAAPEWATTAVEPGDFVLGFACGYHKHLVIKHIQGARLPHDLRDYARYTHAALVVDTDGHLLEAYGDGIRRSHLGALAARPHRVVHIDASAEERERAVAVATDALDRGAGYDAVAMTSAAFSALTGCRLVLSRQGSHTCSGLVARALLATGAIFDVDAAHVTPAQLAIHFGAPPPPVEPRPSRLFGSRTEWDAGR